MNDYITASLIAAAIIVAFLLSARHERKRLRGKKANEIEVSIAVNGNGAKDYTLQRDELKEVFGSIYEHLDEADRRLYGLILQGYYREGSMTKHPVTDIWELICVDADGLTHKYHGTKDECIDKAEMAIPL